MHLCKKRWLYYVYLLCEYSEKESRIGTSLNASASVEYHSIWKGWDSRALHEFTPRCWRLMYRKVQYFKGRALGQKLPKKAHWLAALRIASSSARVRPSGGLLPAGVAARSPAEWSPLRAVFGSFAHISESSWLLCSTSLENATHHILLIRGHTDYDQMVRVS